MSVISRLSPLAPRLSPLVLSLLLGVAVAAPTPSFAGQNHTENDDDDSDDESSARTQRFKRHLPGLDRDVSFTVKQAPKRGWALGASTKLVKAKGKAVPLAVIDGEERAAAYRRFGALDPASFEALKKLPPNGMVDFVLIFSVPREELSTDGSRAFEVIPSGGDGETDPRLAALNAARDSVRAGFVQLSGPIADAGGVSLRAAASFPAIYGSATPAALRRISRLAPDLIRRVSLKLEPSGHLVAATPIVPPEGAESAPGRFPNSASDSNIDCTFNKFGLFGENRFGDDRAIAIFEEAYAGLWESHDALKFATVEYQSEPLACEPTAITVNGGLVKNTAASCQDICWGQSATNLSSGTKLALFAATGKNAPVCAPDLSQCVCGHSSAIASIVSSTFVDAAGYRLRGAAAARILFPNGKRLSDGSPEVDPKKNMYCDHERVAAAYDWMASSNATIAVESWLCDGFGPQTVDGIVQDYYAERFGVLPFRSSGDASPGTKGRPTCTSTNSMCVGSTTYGAASMAADSTTSNPQDSDREEPDVVAFGSGISVMNVPAFAGLADASGAVDLGPAFASPATPHRWRQVGGTSFSAPVAATLGYLAQKNCRAGGDFDTPIGLRSAMRAAGFARNVVGPPESPAGGDTDFQDGGGSPMAETLMLFCADPWPAWHELPNGLYRVHERVTVDSDLGTATPWIATSDDRRAQPLIALRDLRTPATAANSAVLHDDDRVRIAVTWNNCVGSPAEKATGSPPDIDIFLCASSLQGCLGSSQSWLDTNEVIDLHVPPVPVASDWKIWVVTPAHEQGCDGSSRIPVSISAIWATSDAFSAIPTTQDQSCANTF